MIDRLSWFGGSGFYEIVSYARYPLLLYVGLWALRALSLRVWNYLDIKLYTEIHGEVTMWLLKYLSGHSHEYFQNNFSGSLQNKINDLTYGSAKILEKIVDGLGHLMMIGIAIASMVFAHKIFGCILLVWTVVYISIAWFFSGYMQKHALAFSKARTFHIGNIVDMITNHGNMRMFGSRSYEIGRLDRIVNDTVEMDKKLEWAKLKLKAVLDGTIVVMMAAMLFSLLFMYSEGKISIGDFSFVIMLSVSVFSYTGRFVREVMGLSSEFGKCKDALSILNTPHGVVDKEGAVPLHVSRGEIEFEDVTFGYTDQKEKPLFSGHRMRIGSGEKVGLVGFSGAGKTTFVNLLLRFFDLDGGRIMIDGQDIREVTQESLRRQVAMIPQEANLFHRSLMENIRYGRLEATDEEVIEASKKAFCHDFIDLLPNKYDTLVGERGLKLSGGQRQRIAVARAILRDAPILVLDEATSALDSVTEACIQKSLKGLMKERTTIAIAHRLSTLAEMDRLVVFSEGKVIEEGTHEELLQKKGAYARMWDMQATLNKKREQQLAL